MNENIIYKIDGGEATIIGGRELTPELEIPDEIEGYKITAIAPEAFTENRVLETVKIDAELISIGDDAFSFCENLKTINIPPSVKFLGNAVFEGCISLGNLILPPGLEEIPKALFEECASMTYIEIPPGVKIIRQRAFEFCFNLREVVFLGNAVGRIENGAFFLCRRLERFDMPDSVKDTGKEILLGCRQLKHVYLSRNLKKIEHGLLARCKNLTSLIIPESVGEICSGAFAECRGLEYFALENDNVIMGKKVFEGCEKLLADPDFVSRMEKFGIDSLINGKNL